MGPLRIGLTQRVECLPDRGERRDCLDQAWAVLLQSLGFLPIPLANSMADPVAYLEALSLDGLILTGGNDPADLPEPQGVAPERDRFERACLAHSRSRGWPVLGVCRGLQMMLLESGGRLRAIEGHVARSHRLVARRPEFQALESQPVNSYHQYGAMPENLGQGWQVAAVAPDGTVEAMVHETWPHAAIMWHPERAPQRAADREFLRRHFSARPERETT